MNKEYEFILGRGDTITCGNCYRLSFNWFTSEDREILCEDCHEELAKVGASK